MGKLVDFHTHILPRMDDGSSGVQESVEMLECCRDQQIQQVLLTSHFYPQYDSPRGFLQRRQASFEKLLQAVESRQDLPGMRLGAEVYYFEGMSDSDCLEELKIQGTNALLVELPMGAWNSRILREVAGIWEKQGIVPVIAHVDRYMGLLKNRDLPEILADYPVMVQANSSMFLSRLSAGRGIALLERKRIHFLGSDCHNMTSRTPNLSKAEQFIRGKGGEELISWIASCQESILKIH